MALMGTKSALAAPQPIDEPVIENQEDATDEE